MRFLDNPNSTAGKMTVSIVFVGFAVFLFAFLVSNEVDRAEQIARAQTDFATTSVTVLNTPPQWTVNAEEAPESSTSSPTNATTSAEWTAIATDSNAADYFLIICDSAAAPTANSNAPPTCAGSAWALSPTTTSGTQATATRATLVGDPEVNEWWASICDFDVSTPRCNTDIQQGSGSTASPFHVNHRPTVSAYTVSGAGDPGDVVTWTFTGTDADTLGDGGDTLQLFVCQSDDFDFSVPECAGGFSNTWGTSSLYATDPQASTTITIPTQDDTYGAYGFVVDNHGFAALEVGPSATNSPLVVNNVPPVVSPGDIFINEGADIALVTEEGTSTGYILRFEISDDNSCVANASTTSEFNAVSFSVFRGGLGTTSCDQAGEFDINNCYNNEVATTTWDYTDFTSTSTENCTGPTDRTQDFEVVFPLMYVAEPTDGASLTDSTWFGDQWSAMVIASDDDLASSTPATTTNDVDMLSFMAFDLNTTAIAYGPIEPGSTTTVLSATTTVEATGNVGIDQNLDGEDMCTNYSTFDSCFDPSPVEATSTILVGQQQYATTTFSLYDGAAATILTDTPTELEVNVPKSTTTVPASEDIYWGIAIPATIILSGAYTGQNTFGVVTGEAQDW